MLIQTSPLNLIALSKAIDKKDIDASRDQLEPGSYTIDAVVRIAGTLTIGNDYEQHIVARADPWKLLAVALSKLNRATIDSLVKAAENLSDDEASKIKHHADESIKKIKNATKKVCKGKVTPRLAVEIMLENSSKRDAA